MHHRRELRSRVVVLVAAAIGFCILAGSAGVKTVNAGGALPAVAQAPPTTGSLIISDVEQVLKKGFDPFGVVTTYSLDGSSFIAVAGTAIGSADGYSQWVFFFSGSTYLGTDTSQPSPQLSLAGSAGGGQIGVTYVNYAASDPLCCPSLAPITITYTWDGSRVTPNGTPPGH